MKRLDDGRRKAMADEPTLRAAAEALMLMHAAEPEEEAAPRACEFYPAATCSGLGSLMSEVELLGAFPLRNLPEELQLLVAAKVAAPRDRAALCIAVPPLGRKAIKEIKAYKGPLISLGNRVLSGGAVGEAEVRRYMREFAPSGAALGSCRQGPLALNKYAQLNAMAVPSARVRCVVQGSSLEWRLESGALLRCWKLSKDAYFITTMGAPGMHHYEGAAGAERLVSLTFANGEVRDFRRSERGTQFVWQIKNPATGYYRNVDIDGWWEYGFWHPTSGTPAWHSTNGVGDDVR